MSGETLKLIPHYFRSAFSENEQNAVAVNLPLAVNGLEFDTLVGTGLSGSLMIPALAKILKKHYLIVRKSDGSHSDHPAQGYLGRKWLFVDDCIDSGGTIRRVHGVMNDMELRFQWESEFVGAYLYMALTYESAEFCKRNYGLVRPATKAPEPELPISAGYLPLMTWITTNFKAEEYSGESASVSE